MTANDEAALGATATQRLSLVEMMEAIAADAGPDGLTLDELMDRLGERVFGAVLFALALPCCIPFLYLVPQIVAVPMMMFAGQMTVGRGEPWLPSKFKERRIDKAGLERMAKGGRRFFGWVEAFARPRLQFLTGPRAEPFVGALLCVFCASILTPLPSTNTVPGFAVATTSFGLMERDGLLTLLGLILGVLWVGALVFGLFFLGTQGMSAVIDFARGWLSGGS